MEKPAQKPEHVFESGLRAALSDLASEVADLEKFSALPAARKKRIAGLVANAWAALAAAEAGA